MQAGLDRVDDRRRGSVVGRLRRLDELWLALDGDPRVGIALAERALAGARESLWGPCFTPLWLDLAPKARRRW